MKMILLYIRYVHHNISILMDFYNIFTLNKIYTKYDTGLDLKL